MCFVQHTKQIVKMMIVWFIVMRLKRIEVQVAQGQQETTFSMLLKLTYIKKFDLGFSALLICF